MEQTHRTSIPDFATLGQRTLMLSLSPLCLPPSSPPPANITKLDNIDVTVQERAQALEAYGHLSPTHTPNNTGFEASLLGEHSAPGRTPPKSIAPASLLASPSSAMRDAKAPVIPTAPGSDSSGFSASGLRHARAPSNVLYAVLALVKELDGDQLLAVQSEVGLRLQVLEAARH